MSKNRPTWKLREWRRYLGKTQEWLAAETGMHKGDVSALETGASRWNETHLTKFAGALNIPRWWITDIDPNDPANEIQLLEAMKLVPAERRDDLIRVVRALGGADRQPEAEPMKPERATKKKPSARAQRTNRCGGRADKAARRPQQA